MVVITATLRTPHTHFLDLGSSKREDKSYVSLGGSKWTRITQEPDLAAAALLTAVSLGPEAPTIMVLTAQLDRVLWQTRVLKIR